MVTKSTKPVTRETSAYVREKGFRPIIATLTGGVVELRAKGLRTREYIDLAYCYQQAVKQRVAREKAEKKAKRKSK